MKVRMRALCPLLALVLACRAAAAEPVTVAIDAEAGRRQISPLIYGLNFATTAQLAELNVPLNRTGGDSASLYNWRIDARNAGKDWYFESTACTEDVFGQHGDGFVALTKAAGAQPMLTIPMIGWVAKLDRDRKTLASFSIGKYGLQQDFDEHGFTDAGNGRTLDGTPIVGNDPTDAAQPDGPEDEKDWIRALVKKWGTADKGGVRYYLMDNEPSFWHGIHRDVHPVGAHAKEIADKVRDYSAMVKSVDPAAQILAPEEWGWGAYFHSGFDQQYADQHGFDNAPDWREQTKGMDYLPWLLSEWKKAGKPVDVVSVHYYPQGGEYHDDRDDVSKSMQLQRNRSTRDLWDPNYKNTTYINDVVALIPRLRRWVDTYYYPGTPIAITEYNWGGEATMNGGTTQADILGIFGREGLNMATRWATPATGSPAYLAFKLYRNYDGRNSTFGETSVQAKVPDPDTLSAFAAQRKDGTLTVMVINKQLDAPASIKLDLAHFPKSGEAEAYQLAEGHIAALPAFRFGEGALTLPAQSATLLILHGKAD